MGIDRRASWWGRALSILSILPLATFAPARASTIGLSWGPCGLATVSNRSFACDTNEGADTLSVTFISDFNLQKVTSTEVFLDLCVSQQTLPAWWQVMGAAPCRPGGLVMEAGVPGNGCNALFDPAASMTRQMIPILGGGLSTSFGIKFAGQVSLADPTTARDLVAGQEYELFKLVVRHVQTTGGGACTGCASAAGFNSSFIWLFTAGSDNRGTSVFASSSWQVPGFVCHSITPTQRSTWGALKSLYR